MRFILVIILMAAIVPDSYADTYYKLPLTKKNVRAALSAISYQLSSHQPKLTVCNDDSSYYKSDTIILYTRGFEPGCCSKIAWVFVRSSLFYIESSYMCKEPPTSSFKAALYKLNIFSNHRPLTIQVSKERHLMELYSVVSVDHIGNPDDIGCQWGYRIIMVRRKLPVPE